MGRSGVRNRAFNSNMGDNLNMQHDIEWQITEINKGSKRTIRTVGIRKSRVRILNNLSPTQKQASLDIDRAFEDQAKGYGYALLGIKSPAYNSVSHGKPDEGSIDRARKRIGRLHEWQMQCAKDGNEKYIDTIEAIQQTSQTANDYAELTGFATSTIMSWYKKGLDEYVKLQGW